MAADRPSDRGMFGPQFDEAKRLVIERTGHFYYSDKDDLLRERIRRRMRLLGIDRLDTYTALLAKSEEEWTALEAEITIGETFFFRYAEQFAALREVVLPAIVKANEESRRIRVWSAGCSTGAEAYSVAILLDELLGPSLADWRIVILGTDISAPAVAAARTAVFGGWALRGMPPADRERYFAPSGERAWSLRPRYRALARFQQHNLMSLLTAPPPVQFTEFDLILCRNVLIYFHPEIGVRVAAALDRCLAEDRWIFFGHAEAGLLAETSLVPVQLPGTTAYLRSGAAAHDDYRRSPPPVPITPPAAAPAWQPLLPPELPWTASPPVPPTAEVSEPAPTASVETIKSLADSGQIEAALKLCHDRIAADPVAAQFHFYEGLLHYSAGAHAQASSALRRALYLNQDHAVARYYLGLALISMGDTTTGRRAIAAADAQASRASADEPLEDGDGMTPGDLRAMARRYLESAPSAAS